MREPVGPVKRRRKTWEVFEQLWEEAKAFRTQKSGAGQPPSKKGISTRQVLPSQSAKERARSSGSGQTGTHGKVQNG